ncbi:MAG: 3-dehydroquinate synthase [Microbacter sp.]
MINSVIITNDLDLELQNQIERLNPDLFFLLVDTNTRRFCLPSVHHAFPTIEIPAGDMHKTIESASLVWRYLSTHQATRHSLLINLGGGMITDLGGFVASTFKRGIRYINVPTTLLGAVDAAVGGKTGVNFDGLKNEIGVIRDSEAVILYPLFFASLDHQNFLSGWAEMLKHALLSSSDTWDRLMAFPMSESIDYQRLAALVEQSIGIKESIVEKDPTEQNLRKALNLGHTFGHAFESFSYVASTPLLHGYAVAYGLVCELYLSTKMCGFPANMLTQVTNYVRQYYGAFPIDVTHFSSLMEWMGHDKKNDAEGINVTLLRQFGDVLINQHVKEVEIMDALRYFSVHFA